MVQKNCSFSPGPLQSKKLRQRETFKEVVICCNNVIGFDMPTCRIKGLKIYCVQARQGSRKLRQLPPFPLARNTNVISIIFLSRRLPHSVLHFYVHTTGSAFAVLVQNLSRDITLMFNNIICTTVITVEILVKMLLSTLHVLSSTTYTYFGLGGWR